MRLGLALSKSVAEVRALPYPEYRRWQIFYLLEPWGFEDREYRTSALLAQIYNANVGKKGKLKKYTSFMRDMPRELLRHLRNEVAKETSSYDLDTPEGRAQATQEILNRFKMIWGEAKS